MLKEVADFVKNITNAVNALGINLKTTDDGLQLDVIGNTINANIKDGKVQSINVDMKGNLEEVINRVADAFEELDYNKEPENARGMYLEMLDNIPTPAEVNPDTILAIAHYGYQFLFGGGVTVGVLITDSDKAEPVFHDKWTQYSPDEQLFGLVKELIGVGAPTLNELFNGGINNGESHVKINTNWGKIHILNQLPEALNQGGGLVTVRPNVNIVTPIMEGVVKEAGLIVGGDQYLTDDVISALYAPLLNDIGHGASKSKISAFDIRRDPPMKTICRELRLAEAVARVVYSTQIAYLTNEYQINLIEGYPNEHSVRKTFDTRFSDLDYDTKSKLVKMYLVTWDKED